MYNIITVQSTSGSNPIIVTSNNFTHITQIVNKHFFL